MFTGLIEGVGEIVGLAPMEGGSRLRVKSGLAPELVLGESVAVNGACLTVTSTTSDEMTFDLGPETLRVTALGALGPGARVNLERSMRADGRLGGHLVLGHVDGVGQVVAVREEGEAHWVTVAFPDALEPLLVPKGSVAMSGISLTVAGLGQGTMDIMIVPFTWAHTNVAALRPGDAVNLEADVIGKYVVRALAVRGLGTGPDEEERRW
ncbi:MAG: riboflavin synthase [Vicinamibacterales bacterium]|nr:riboflavin synthase [Vicinamibacterales bacterium]